MRLLHVSGKLPSSLLLLKNTADSYINMHVSARTLRQKWQYRLQWLSQGLSLNARLVQLV